jgi:hypothetical protein
MLPDILYHANSEYKKFYLFGKKPIFETNTGEKKRQIA